MFTTGNEIVDKVGMINLEGNIIPHAWYIHRHTGGLENG